MSKAFKTVGFMFIMILISKVLGQAREMIIASVYGTGGEANAFYAASTLPLNLFDIVFASSVSSAFIPVYNTYIEKSGQKEGDRFASAFVNSVFLIALFLCIILMLCASPLVSVIAKGLTGETKALAERLTVIMMPVIPFACLTFSCVGILQSKGEFNIPAVISLVSNGAVIIYLAFFNDRFGISGLAVSLVIGWLLQFAIQLPAIKKVGFRYDLKILYHEGLKDVVKLALPVLIGTWIQPISNIINTAFASGIDGGISALNYASKLYLIVSAVFTVSVTNYIFPKLSRQSASSDKDDYKKTLGSSFNIIVLVLIPVCALMLSLHRPVIEIIYMRGEFNAEALELTSGAFFYYSLGIVFYGVLDLLNKAFYARKNSIVPAAVSAAAIGLNFIFSYILKKYMGLFGLSLSTTLVYMFMALMLFALLNKKIGFFGKKDLVFLIKLIIYGILSFAVCTLVNKTLSFGDGLIFKILKTGISAISGLATYGIFIFVFHGKELKNGKN